MYFGMGLPSRSTQFVLLDQPVVEHLICHLTDGHAIRLADDLPAKGDVPFSEHWFQASQTSGQP